MRGRQIRPALALSMTVFNAGILTALAADYSYSGFDTYESPEAAKAKLRAEYGENRQTTDDNYDKSLAVKCINGTFVGKKTENPPARMRARVKTASLYVQGEDCLYLNIWKADDARTEKKPVMVWIQR